jgi:membrane-associated protease RseP (regulator of RpoE activity)
MHFTLLEEREMKRARGSRGSRLLLAGALVTASALVGVVAIAQPWTNTTEGGVLIASVDPAGPAAAAGVQRGDIVIEVDGEAVADRPEFLRAISDKGSGDTVRVVLTRGAARRTLAITVGDRSGAPYLGVLMAADGAAERTFGDRGGGRRGGMRRDLGGHGQRGGLGSQGHRALPTPQAVPSA